MDTKSNFYCPKLFSLRWPTIAFFVFAILLLIMPIAFAGQEGKTAAQAAVSIDASPSMPETTARQKKGRVTTPISPAAFKPISMEGTLQEGESDYYEIRLEAGQYLHLVIDQQGVDVVVFLIAPPDATRGEVLAQVDRPNLRFGPEPISWVAGKSGVFTVRVEPLMKPQSPGRYTLIELEVRKANPGDRQRVAAERLMAEAEQLRARGEKLRSAKERDWLAEALEKFQKARTIWQALRSDQPDDENNYELALASFGIGLCHRARGEFAVAATEFRASLADLKTVTYRGARYTEAAVTTNLARCVLNISGAKEARDLFASTINTRVDFNDTYGLGVSLSGLADAQAALGDYGKAEQYLAEALKYKGSDKRGIALTLVSIGRLQTQRSRYAEAIKTFQEAQKLLRELGENEGYVLVNIGRAYAQQNDYRNAGENLDKAIELVKGYDPASEAMSRYELARIKRRVGDLQSARDNIKLSVELIESLNQRGADPNLRARSFASTRELYEFAISVNMQMHKNAPNQNHAADALQISERMHGRHLQDLLSNAIEQCGNNNLSAGARLEMELVGRKTNNKANVILSRLQPLDLRRMQQELDPDTLLLEYAISPNEAFMWAVTRSTFHSFSLPAEQVKQSAQNVIDMLIKDAALVRTYQTEMASLGKLLLPESSASLVTQYKKLVIVPDGILHTLPFAGLALPGQSYEPLVATHEIINLPSLSTLALARRQDAGPKPAPNSVMVLADPIYTRSDERLLTLRGCDEVGANAVASPDRHRYAPNKAPANSIRKVSDLSKDTDSVNEAFNLSRLRRTAREATMIKTLQPSAVISVGKDTSLEKVKSGMLSRYQVVHFATHMATREENGSEMGIILSQFDQCARPRDGFLGVSEILNQRFLAELVVLSSCEYGVGQDAAGEWVEGLSTAFIHAGARRVVASMWPLQGRVTTEFMERFYLALFEDKRSPAAALRQVQTAMWREGRFSPADYLGFTTYGEWRQ